MTATDTTTEAPNPLAGHVSLSRRMRDGLATTFVWGSVVAALVPLSLVIVLIVQKGAAIVDFDFLVDPIPPQRVAGPGMGPAVFGTILITAAATLMAVPLGVLGAIYLNEYGAKGMLARVLRFLADVMTGVPSIVMGLFIYVTLVLATGNQTGFAGALALACLMLPIVIRSSEEMLRLVPNSLRAASYALGARRWNTIVKVVVPAAMPGLVSGSLLAVAHAAGETAPVLFTIGALSTLRDVTWNPLTWIDQLFRSNTTLSVQIFNNAKVGFPTANERAFGAALTLVAIVLIFTIAARVISRRFTLAR